jgi:hypothetical protein
MEIPMTKAMHELGDLVNNLDLEPIIFKLTTSEYGEPPQMTLAEADAATLLYRQFLTLKLLYPRKSLVPTRAIDAVWHTHILDTAKYRDDCAQIFGRTLDHFPYLGLRGEEDRQAWRESANETRRLFQEHFGVDFSTTVSMCNGGCDDGSQCVDFIDDQARPRPSRGLTTS